MTDFLTEARATAAKRAEDLRIARKHEEEASARTWNRENRRAYLDAVAWTRECAARECAARSVLIAFHLHESTRATLDTTPEIS